MLTTLNPSPTLLFNPFFIFDKQNHALRVEPYIIYFLTCKVGEPWTNVMAELALKTPSSLMNFNGVYLFKHKRLPKSDYFYNIVSLEHTLKYRVYPIFSVKIVFKTIT